MTGSVTRRGTVLFITHKWFHEGNKFLCSRLLPCKRTSLRFVVYDDVMARTFDVKTGACLDKRQAGRKYIYSVDPNSFREDKS